MNKDVARRNVVFLHFSLEGMRVTDAHDTEMPLWFLLLLSSNVDILSDLLDDFATKLVPSMIGST